MGDSAQQANQPLEGTRAKELIHEAGYRFTSECISVANSDGSSWPATYFAAILDIFKEDKVTNGIKEFASYRWLRAVDDYFEYE